MKTEYQVMEKLQEVLSRGILEHLELKAVRENLGADNFLIDFPDVDNMRKDIMFYIQPEYEDLEDLTVSSDTAAFDVSIYILCRRDTNANLIRKVFDCYQAIYQALRKNDSLDGFIEFSRITDMEYYPSVSSGQTMTAIEISLVMNWAKEF